jgi:hypothetical protein
LDLPLDQFAPYDMIGLKILELCGRPIDRAAAEFGHGVAPWLTKAATATHRREESAIAAVMKYLRRFIPAPGL